MLGRFLDVRFEPDSRRSLGYSCHVDNGILLRLERVGDRDLRGEKWVVIHWNVYSTASGPRGPRFIDLYVGGVHASR